MVFGVHYISVPQPRSVTPNIFPSFFKTCRKLFLYLLLYYILVLNFRLKNHVNKYLRSNNGTGTRLSHAKYSPRQSRFTVKSQINTDSSFGPVRLGVPRIITCSDWRHEKQCWRIKSENLTYTQHYRIQHLRYLIC